VFERKSRLGKRVLDGKPFDVFFKSEPNHILVTGRTGWG